MKKVLLIFSIALSFNVFAKVTIDDVNRSMDAQDRQYSSISDAEIRQKWDSYAKIPRSESQTALKVTTTEYYARNKQVKLRPTNGYVCAVAQAGGYYHRGLKGVNVRVYPSGAYWYLSAKSTNADNWGRATCWNTK